MTILFLPASNKEITDFPFIQKYLNDRGIEFERWEAKLKLSEKATEAEILQAYAHEVNPYMAKKNFLSCDVISVYPSLENIEVIRQKFLSEHTHSEDEVRFFVDGEGKFWFHLDTDEVICLTCTKGDFLAVPTGIRHWFDLAPKYFVKAIRIFTSKEGWVAKYTESGVDKKYNE